MYQQGKSQASSFYNFNFHVKFLGHHKMTSSKVTSTEVNIIKWRQNGKTFCSGPGVLKLRISNAFVHFECFVRKDR